MKLDGAGQQTDSTLHNRRTRCSSVGHIAPSTVRQFGKLKLRINIASLPGYWYSVNC